MHARLKLTALWACLLAGCAPQSSIPDGAVVLDEEVTFTRQANVDFAQREIAGGGTNPIACGLALEVHIPDAPCERKTASET